MTLALQSLVGLTLLIAGAVASLPLLIGRAAPKPDPGAPDSSGPLLRVVEAPGGRWYLRGDPIARPSLASLLRSNRPPQTLHYLPSGALSIGEVSTSLRWLRRINGGAAVLALPPRGEAPP